MSTFSELEIDILSACFEFVKDGNIGMEAIDGYYGIDVNEEGFYEVINKLSKKI